MKKSIFLFLILSARISFADSDIDLAEAQARSIKQNALAMAIACVKYGEGCPERHQKQKEMAIYNLLVREARTIIGDRNSTPAQLEEALAIVDYATVFHQRRIVSGIR
ncbi:MAG: hypothetical protein JNM39_05670 [Bdellovibrionaceae bacterium]|nr:hypothetical protein [Pseudobdellovibrionaceae bacterium]